MNEPVYHVLLEGSKVGPYDRRTVVGMRIKKTLSSEQVLIASDGQQLTVADLVKLGARGNAFQPNRSGSYSRVQATYSGSLLSVSGPGIAIPRFRGEIEARVQSDVLRLAGRFRKGLVWREDRAKVPLDNIVHARVRGSIVDLWLRQEGATAQQQVTLELFTPESAGEFVDWLPHATPVTPVTRGAEAATALPRGRHEAMLMWVAVIGVLLAIAGALLLYVLTRR